MQKSGVITIDVVNPAVILIRDCDISSTFLVREIRILADAEVDFHAFFGREHNLYTTPESLQVTLPIPGYADAAIRIFANTVYRFQINKNCNHYALHFDRVGIIDSQIYIEVD